MLWPSGKVAAAITETARREGTSKILFGTPWPLAFLAPRLARAGLSCACIVHGAEMIVPGAVPMLRSRLSRALASCELLLPVSEYTARYAEELLKRTRRLLPRMEVLRARVDLDRFKPDVETASLRERLGIDASDRVALCFGRLVPRKGVHRLIDAMPAISQRVPAAKLVVAGTGPEERKLRRLAQRSGANVVFTGRVASEDAAACYAMAGVFVLPVVDRWFGLEIEGLGVVLLEAAASGVPCVTGRSGGTPEAVVDGVTGYTIDARDRGALIDRVVSLLVEPALAEKMGAAGRVHVARNFSGSETLNPLLEWLGTGVR
jgi:phosphatidylinositol alpha-1,6-mannosyltransferase